jgi:hypothetical protein
MVEILKEKLKQIFGKTAASLAPDVWRQNLDDFLNEVAVDSADFAATTESERQQVEKAASYFPVYLRLQKMAPATVQAAYFEWIVYSRSHLDFGRPRQEKGFLSVSSSLEILPVTAAAVVLEMPEGVYAVLKKGNQAKIFALQMTHLAMLEKLREGDRKYRAAQLVEGLTREMENDLAEWQSALKELIQWGLIQDNDGDGF